MLLVTLEAARLRGDVHPLPALRLWRDSWRGIGAVDHGVARQGFDLQLTRYDERGWRATFYARGIEVLAHERNGLSVGAHTVARDAAGRRWWR